MFRITRTISVTLWALALATTLGGDAAAAMQPPRDPARQQHAAGEVQVELTCDAVTLRVSDSLHLTLRVTYPPTHRVKLPEFREPDQPIAALGDFTIAAVLDDAPVASGTPESPRTTLTRRVTLDPFLPGTYTIPELEIEWQSIHGDERGVLRTQKFAITVESLLPPAPPLAAGQAQSATAPDPGDIKPEMEVPSARSSSPLVVGAVGLTGVGLMLAWLWRRRDVSPDPLCDVEDLLASWPHDGRDAPECPLADALVRCGRAALADRVDRDAAACSGPELRRLLPAVQGDAAAKSLIELVERMDQIRFSGTVLEPDDRRQSLADVLAAVRVLRGKPRLSEGVRQ